MKRVYYIIAVLLALSWALTFFFFRGGAQAHVLIMLAMVCYLHAVLIAGSTRAYTTASRNTRKKVAWKTRF